MKFAYIDESGDRQQSNVFVMAGVLVDAYRLRKKTQEFDTLLQDLFARHPGTPRELKTKAFMRGAGGWKEIPGNERQEFLQSICKLAIDKGNKIYGIAVDLQKHAEEKDKVPVSMTYWLSSAMYVASLIQKRMQAVKFNKGVTAMVMDDNKMEMSNLSDLLYEAPDWFDGLYQIKRLGVWRPRKDGDRFDQIINTGFSVKSEHSSLVQVADAISWTYRRSLELLGTDEEWKGEREYYSRLRKLLDKSRSKLGSCAPCDAKDHYCAIAYEDWKL